MNHEQIGLISLRISFFIYLIYFIPQIWLNFKKKTTAGLSLNTHFLLFLAYILDLAYAWGLNMQIEYKLVNFSGLLSLLIQHFQIFFYIKSIKDLPKIKYWKIISLCFTSLILFILGGLYFKIFSKFFLIGFGFIAGASWMTYIIPQLINNFKNPENKKGLSIVFIILCIIGNSSDIVSAWMLNWELPSKIYSPLSLICKFIFAYQYFRKTP